ncbi:MAG: hypothetical protein AAF514_00200, partial [Verrucomicrobiota bacterium]
MVANPFESVVFSGDLAREMTYLPLYRPVLDRLRAQIERCGEPGSRGSSARVVLIAPAGAGKSHLLARVEAESALSPRVMKPRVDPGSFEWEELFAQALDWLHEEVDGETTRLETLSRRMFAGITADLIESDALECPLKASVLPWLRENPQRLFYLDETEPAEKWIHEHFESAG